MDKIFLNENDELIIKLLHYFVTEENYSPVVLRGAKDEIWLEKLDGKYKIVRLVSNYIHNNTQLDTDVYRTNQIMKKIKKKTMSFTMNALSIYVNLGDNADINSIENDNINLVKINDVDDLNKYDFVIDEFPQITKKTTFEEKGIELFMKLTSDIGKKSDDDAKKAEDIFTKKTPYITNFLIAINALFFICSFIYGPEKMIYLLGNYSTYIKQGEFYRLLSSAFVHVNFLHFGFNMYALYIIGSQLENFFGKARYLAIYLISAIIGSLFSIVFNDSSFSIGASGAVFGLLGALIYFGYHYRVYLDSVVKSQIIPLIIFNLFLGFMFSNIDTFGHIGGLVGGVLAAWSVGVKYKSTKSDIVNGIIMLVIFTAFLIFLLFSR